MLKSALAKIRTQLVVIVAAMVSVAVAVVALGFTVYNGLCLLVIPVGAAALTTLIFFLIAACALLFLQFQPRRPEPEEPSKVVGVLSAVDWARVAPLVGQIALALTTIFSERSRGRRDDRRRDRR